MVFIAGDRVTASVFTSSFFNIVAVNNVGSGQSWLSFKFLIHSISILQVFMLQSAPTIMATTLIFIYYSFLCYCNFSFIVIFLSLIVSYRVHINLHYFQYLSFFIVKYILLQQRSFQNLWNFFYFTFLFLTHSLWYDKKIAKLINYIITHQQELNEYSLYK